MHGEKFSSPAALHGFLSRLPGCDQDDGERISLLNGASVVGQPPPPYYGGVIAPPYEDKASTVIDIHKRDWKPCQKKRSYESTNWLGILLAFLSGAFFTLSSAAVKALRSLDPMELLVLRAVLQVLVMLPFACRSGQPLLGPKGYRCLLQLQGFVGGVTLVLLFITFRRLPLGDATTIIFSSPVCVMILSFLFLREPCGFFRTFIVCLLVTGVVLIAKPPFLFVLNNHKGHHHYDLGGYLCAISATVFTALNMVVMRKCKAVHFSLIVLHLSVWSLLSAGAVLLIRHRGFRPDWIQGAFYSILPHGWWQCLLVGCVSGFGLAGQVLVARALGLEGAGKVAVTRSLDIILAFVLQVFVFGEIPDWLSVLGAFFVLLCVIAMGLEEQIINFAHLIP